ncbi:MAG: drug:proton antiporter, partial [Rhodobacteraceae bacterium]|nr:drug:proton antiporter [Paracoccaceae bacterium]
MAPLGRLAPRLAPRLALRLALRDLRGSFGRFWVFLACLALAVAAISGVGTLRAAITNGLSQQGAVILGGDAQIELTYRFASPDERGWMAAHSLRLSEVVDFRSMAVVGDDSALAQVKAVDDAYPLTGQVVLQAGDVAGALQPAGGLPSAIVQDTLADRLALRLGDTFRLGSQTFRLGGVLLREPDSTGAGLMFGPRIIVKKADLATSGLLAPGTLFETQYRMTLAPDTDLARLKRQAERAFDGKGMRWSDRRQAAPGVQGFVDRLGSFLVLVGLAGLAVGGVGIQAAVRSHLEARIATIATLRSLGATSGLIFGMFLAQIAVMAL